MRIAVSRAPGAERVVTPLELFFDLVYVFAIGQLSHHLLEHVDLRSGVETAILTLAVIYAWYMVAWGANWLDPDRLPVRLLLVGTAFSDEPFEVERLLALAIGFSGTVALWWCYFQRAEAVGVEVVEGAEDAGAVAWLGTWTLTLMVLALIGIAVGDELANRPSRRRRDSRLHAPDVRRAGAVPARPDRLSAPGGRARPSFAAGGRGGAGDPRRRQRAAHADRRDRGCERRARRGRGLGLGPGGHAGRRYDRAALSDDHPDPDVPA
jgi:Bacterial low temperature requirement A protein (LtrA)